MKKLLVLFFIITSYVFAQDYGDPSFYDSVTTVNDLSTFQIRQDNLTKVLTWSRLNSIISANLDLSNDYTWTGTHNFTSELQAPSTLSGSLSNGLGYNSGLFSWVESGAIKTGADRAWVLQMIADSGVAVDTNNFGLLAGDQTWSGNNYFSAQLAVGASTNNGELKIPVYTSTNRPTAVDGSTFYHVGENRIYIYDTSIWRPFLDSTAVAALVTTGSYLPQSGTATGLSSTLTWTSGTITPKKISFGSRDAGRSLILPLDKNGVVSAEEGSILFDYNNDDEIKVHNGSSWITFPNETTMNAAIDANLSNDAPTTDADATATINWLNKNYSQKICGDTDVDQTITVSNYTSGWCAFYIKPNLNTTTISISGVTIQWVGDVTPTFNNNKYYKVMLEYYNSTTALGSYTWF